MTKYREEFLRDIAYVESEYYLEEVIHKLSPEDISYVAFMLGELFGEETKKYDDFASTQTYKTIMNKMRIINYATDNRYVVLPTKPELPEHPIISWLER